MQFVEVDLSEEEVQSLSRFAPKFETEYALNAGYKIISLARTIEAGGCVDKKVRPKQKDSDTFYWDRNPGVMQDPREMRYERMRYNEQRYALGYGREREMEMLREPLGPVRYNVPALALAPSGAQAVTLTSGSDGYRYERGQWSETVKPKWHTPFQRGQAGNDLHRSNFESKLPPVPREAREEADNFDWSLLLWEADWEEEEQYLDPAIIVPVWKDLYAVVYTWDLTKIELSALKKASRD